MDYDTVSLQQNPKYDMYSTNSATERRLDGKRAAKAVAKSEEGKRWEEEWARVPWLRASVLTWLRCADVSEPDMSR